LLAPRGALTMIRTRAIDILLGHKPSSAFCKPLTAS
jgi:hypothetical protein